MVDQFRLHILLENDAFAESGHGELARILRETAARLEGGLCDYRQYQTLRDVNGNDVGRAGIKPLEEELHLPGAMSREP